MHWLSWLAHLGAAQGFILALAIITIPYGNRQANRILAVFLCAESLRLLSLSYYYLEVNILPGVPIYQLHHLSYAFGPLLYLYVHSLVDKDFTFRARYLWHFTPVVVAIIVFMPGLFVSDEFRQYDTYSALPWALKSKISLVSLPVYISLCVYSILALRHLQRHQMSIRREFSSLESISLKWLKWLLWLCLFSAISAGAVELLQALMLVELGSRVVVSEITSVAIIYYIGLMGLRQPLIFDLDQKAAKLPVVDDTPPPDSTPETDSGKYKKSGLRDEEVQRLWEKLTILMAEEKPYTQAGLKLGELASKVRGRPDYSGKRA